ncbi:MAG: tail fiber protein, partial [Saprospiraceae bacterium]|nr:tail fiber protein [Saprospiraceae bacterium]MDZ4706192.1 tail fiber protein [Saprospiraceae bacterium]
MSQPYVGEIRMFGGNFAPLGWMFCDGSLLSIAENETLFQLIGTTYGGDGQQTFALPDLRGRIPVHMGGNAVLAEAFGTESVTLSVNQMPAHSHPFLATDNNGSGTSPNGTVLSRNASADAYTSDGSTGLIPLNNATVSPAGDSQPHENMAPYLCVSFIISLYGIFPSQT